MTRVPGARLNSKPDGKENPQGGSAAFEPHFTLAELAKRWHLSRSTIRDWFLAEPGVLVVTRSGRRSGRRTLTNMRIPQSVAERVHGKRVRS
ncbi:MAG: hypothetical protein R2748_11695 [Bryobacterales bacterium]